MLEYFWTSQKPLNQDILLHRHSYSGISSFFKMFLYSYLSNRQQYVSFANSEIAQITTGIPQESILCRLRFQTSINDFVNTSTFSNFILFADDTTSISKMYAKNINLISKELAELFFVS